MLSCTKYLVSRLFLYHFLFQFCIDKLLSVILNLSKLSTIIYQPETDKLHREENGFELGFERSQQGYSL